jgi:cytochrome c oxidase cbb3-type subunit III
MQKLSSMIFNGRPAKVLWALAGLFLLQNGAYAQAVGGLSPEVLLMAIVTVLVLIVLLLLAVAYYIIKVVNMVLQDNLAKERAAAGLPEPEAEPSWMALQFQKLWGTRPLQEEGSILMHHDYDGIQELDNHLPPWWKYLFYLTIAFSVVYVFVYHISGTLPLQEEEYQREMMAAAKAAEMRLASADVTFIDENSVEFVTDAASLTQGATLYARHCVVCHGANGEGGIGPNLTDEYWLHGGSVSDVFKVIKYGVVEKGMIPWQTTLNPTQMQNVTSFILTLEGTNPANAKAPEGQIYIRETVVEEPESEDSEEEESEIGEQESGT